MNTLANQLITSCSCNVMSPKFYLLAIFMGLFQLPADAAALALLQSGDVFGDTALFLWCVIGSSGGAYMAVFCFPPTMSKGDLPESEHLRFMIQKLCAKFGFSLIAGGLLSPLLMRLLSVPTDRTYVVGCSTLVAFSVAALIHLGANMLDSWKQRRVVYITNNNSGQVQQQFGEANKQDQG
jgi:hypothetical protein